MSNALIPVPDFAVANEEMFGEIAKASSGFLPRLQLFTGQSGLVKERKFPADHYGLLRRKDFIEDLGEELEVIPITVRSKAIRGLQGDEQQTYYDHNNPEFRKIMVESESPDSGAMYGPEFLVWLPGYGEFAQFFCGSKSARLESQVLFNIYKQGKAATLKSRVVKNKKYTWVTIAVAVCSTPFSPAQLPSGESVEIESRRFMEAKSNNAPLEGTPDGRAR